MGSTSGPPPATPFRPPLLPPSFMTTAVNDPRLFRWPLRPPLPLPLQESQALPAPPPEGREIGTSFVIQGGDKIFSGPLFPGLEKGADVAMGGTSGLPNAVLFPPCRRPRRKSTPSVANEFWGYNCTMAETRFSWHLKLCDGKTEDIVLLNSRSSEGGTFLSRTILEHISRKPNMRQ